jgi:glycerol-3-phosphate dehydrogenase (NAD(P)+)
MEYWKNIGVIGAGSWATALVKILQDSKNHINWHVRLQEDIDHIKQYSHNPSYVSSIELKNDLLFLSTDINEIVERSDLLLVAIPSIYLYPTLQDLKLPLKDKTIVSAIKGIVPEKNLIVGELFNTEYGVPYENIGVVTGPCHAEEVALERLSYLTVAFSNAEKAEAFANLLNNHYINTTLSDDIIGTEYAAVLKNIYALTAGVCNGLGYGDNFQAVLISNAIREMKAFTDTVYPIKRDIKGSAYLGDLLVTAYSQFSRNRHFGTLVGKGYTVDHIRTEMDMVAEGYYACKCIHEINLEHNVDMPIAETLYDILYRKASVKRSIKQLTNKLS